MQFMSFTAQGTHHVADSPTESPARHTLFYRGATYQVPQQGMNRAVQAQKQLARLAGQRLSYRGATYVMVTASISEAIEPKTMHRLVYRGVSYQLP